MVRTMDSKYFVYAYESEPSLDRTTGFGRTDHSVLSTSPAQWTASEHSTFEQPSRSSDSLRARKVRQENVRLIDTALIAAVAVFAAVAVALFR